MFEWGKKTYVMGIVNITPDSFSGDGVLVRGDAVQTAVSQAQQFVADGADIIDIGGESTR
ncbi:MAG: dihydropteroate synthase, partial [Anaerolineales bacterium]|nr:dihydropteroate synthase [Anaerolineales bacterium]